MRESWTRDRKWCLRGGKHYAQVDSGSLKLWDHECGGPTVWMNWILKKFKPPCWNPGGSEFTSTLAYQHLPHGPVTRKQATPPGVPHSQGLRANTWVRTIFGLFSDVFRRQVSKARTTKKPVIQLQQPWQSHKWDSVQYWQACARSFKETLQITSLNPLQPHVGHPDNERLRPLLLRFLPGLTVCIGSVV